MLKKFNHPLVYIVLVLTIAFGFRHFFSSQLVQNGSSQSTQAFFAASFPNELGKTQPIKQYENKIIVLNFWASWCEPCRAEMPTLQQVADLYGPDKLLVLAINYKETATRALQFAKTTGVTLPILLDITGKTATQWGVKVFPTTLSINSRGQPQQRIKGEVDWTGSASAKLIEALIKA